MENGSRGNTISFNNSKNSPAQYDLSRNNDPLVRVHSSFASEDVPDATSEKDLVGALFFYLHLFWSWGYRVVGS